MESADPGAQLCGVGFPALYSSRLPASSPVSRTTELFHFPRVSQERTRRRCSPDRQLEGMTGARRPYHEGPGPRCSALVRPGPRVLRTESVLLFRSQTSQGEACPLPAAMGSTQPLLGPLGSPSQPRRPAHAGVARHCGEKSFTVSLLGKRSSRGCSFLRRCHGDEFSVINKSILGSGELRQN